MSEELRKDEDFVAIPAHREAKGLYGAYEALSAPDSVTSLSNDAEGKEKKRKKAGGTFVKREKSQKVPRICLVAGVYMPK